jgi:hypothetical protein
MSWWGFMKGGAAMIVIVETPDDAAYTFSHPAGGPITMGPKWRAQLGRFGYPRSVRFGFMNGGYVDLCKRYRRYVIDSDAFLLRLDSNGTQQWLKKFGSPGKAYGIALLKCDDGAIVLAGERHNRDILLIKSPDAPDALAPLEETIKPVEVLLYHHPEIIYCITPLFLAAFVSLSVALITIKRSLDKRKKPP